MRNEALAFLFSIQNEKILDLSTFEAFADDKLNLVQMFKSHFHRVENIVGKGENAGYQHFLLFPQCFLKPSLSLVVISWDFVGKSYV